MADGKIYITISDTRGGSSSGVSNVGGNNTSQLSESSSSSSKESPFKIIAKTQFANFIIGEAKQMVSYSISNIGDFTGDYEAQRNIQQGLKIASTVGNIVNSFAQGNIIGGLLAIASVGTTKGLEVHKEKIEIKKVNREISILKQRSGLNSLYDGGRGTEN